MRSRQIFLIIILSFLFVQCSYSSQSDSNTILLNGSWDFKYISGGEIPEADKNFFKVDFIGDKWEKIIVPSNWELQGKAEPNYAGRIEEGIGLYRTTFNVPKNFNEENVFVRFDGVLFAYELFVNGEFVGKWSSAFNSKQFDISSYINENSTNLLAVKVFTHTERGTHQFDVSDCWSLSGIFRDVALVSVPNIYFQDFKFNTEILSDNSAKFSVYSTISSFENINLKNLTVEGSLVDNQGEQVYSFNLPARLSEQGQSNLDVKDVIENPKLWSAENPNLYHLNLTLYNDGKFMHSINKKVGIREVKIENGVLLLNNSSIKLRGVCMHEIHPERGRALTDRDRLKDLTMAKNANINFIRTSHYPHNQRFFEMCDSMGFYVMAEVPFNFGPRGYSSNLDYLPDLITRAEATVSKHKNHPCIITWSIGNENNLAEVYTKVAEYVAEKDPSRPRCFPQAPNSFKSQWTETPDVFNILAPHYLNSDELTDLSKESKRPIIMSEYAHSLGNSIDNLEDNWKVARTHQNIAGAAIWLWSDQGIKRNGNFEKLNSSLNHDEVWIDSTTYYDGHHVNGNDGIVYSNRYPQVDYWLVRKVYSPIWVNNKQINTSLGKQNLKIELENRLDFNSLKGYKCRWILKHYHEELEQGTESLFLQAKSKGIVEIPLNISRKIPGEFILTLNFVDSMGKSVYDTNVHVVTENKPINYTEIFINKEDEVKSVSMDQQNNSISVFGKSYSFSIDQSGIISFVDKKTEKILLSSAPVLRVGRKPSLKLIEQGRRRKEKFYWDPYLIFTPDLIAKKIDKTENGFVIVLTYKWHRQEKGDEYIKGDIIFNIENNLIQCNYELTPYNATGYFMELGLGFQLPEHFDNFRWLGHGPYIAAPGKTMYNERDVWALHKNDYRFEGNREKSDIVTFYENDNVLGIGFIGNKSNFGVEAIDNKIIVTNNISISSFGTKVHFPRYFIEADSVKNINGNFSLLKIDDDSELINLIFSPFQNEVNIEKPFLKSYGL